MPLRTDLLNPIPGDSPSGANLRYDPVFDKIKEARREDFDAPQGAWKTTVKTAEHGQVIKLAGDVIAKKSKDLQLAVWIVEAYVRKEGLSVVGGCFQFVHDLLEQFWDTLYPELEDGDAELRAGPLEWLGSKLDGPVRLAPLTSNGLNFLAYKESRLVGYEADVGDSYEKQTTRAARVEEGKLTAEQFDEGVDATPMAFYGTSLSSVNEALAQIEALNDFCDEHFGSEAPGFTNTRKALEDVGQLLENFLRKKGGAVPVKSKDEDEEEPTEESDSSGSVSPYSLDDVSFSFDAAPEPTNTGFAADDLTGSDTTESSDDDSASTPVASFASAEPQNEEDVVRQLAAVCRYLRIADAQDPAPYMILRGYQWGRLRMAAPPIRPSAMIPPSSELRVQLKTLLRNQDWNALLAATEEALELPCAGPWVDLHRYAAVALEVNGMLPIAKAIRTGLKGLIEDLPQLKTAVLLDDTPAISAETQAWLEAEVFADKSAADTSSDEPSSDDTDSSSSDDSSSDYSSSSEDSSDSDTSSDSSSSDDTASDSSTEASSEPVVAPMEFPPIDENPPILEEFPPDLTEDNRETFEVAQDAVKSGDAKEGMKLISDKLAMERSNRGRFKRRTQLAHLLMEGGHAKVAEALLEQLASEIEERKLEEWEDGEVVAYPLELLLRCVAADGAEVEKRAELYTKLCKLDPVRAMAISF